jgi:hypothetical protein
MFGCATSVVFSAASVVFSAATLEGSGGGMSRSLLQTFSTFGGVVSSPAYVALSISTPGISARSTPWMDFNVSRVKTSAIRVSHFIVITDDASVAVSKSHLFGLVSTQSDYPFDDYIVHGNHVPTAPNNLLSCVQRHKFESTLQITTWSKSNGALATRMHTVSRGDFLVHLTILLNLKMPVMFIIETLPRHDGFGAQSIRNPPLWREEVKEFNSMEDDVNRQELGNSFTKKTSSVKKTSFSSFNNSVGTFTKFSVTRWGLLQGFFLSTRLSFQPH